MINLYVYGTLRGPVIKGRTKLVTVPAILYDLDWYPGIRLIRNLKDEIDFIQQEHKVVCEKLEIDENTLKQFDNYEGYDPNNIKSSLYIRVPILDGFIYEYNRDLIGRRKIESGDWFDRGGDRPHE